MLLAVLMVAGMLPAQVLAEELAPVIQEDNVVPTEGPTEQPTEKPTETATGAPTDGATETPTDGATEAPTDAAPTDAPTEAPATEAPTEAPTEEPTEEPTEDPKSRAADAENYLILSEDYTSLGTWTIVSADAKDDWHNLHLKGKTNENTTGNEPAVATINVETAGTYYLWVNTKPYLNTPAKRHFEIDINGTQTAEKYGTEAGADDSQPYEWYGPVEVTLNAGSNTVKAVDTSSYYAHLNGILLTSAPSLDPNGMTCDEIEAVSVRNTPEVEVTGENYLILSDSYDTLGNWTVVQADAKDDWNNAHLKGGEDRADHSATPAVATIDDVTAGTYYLWVNDKQFNTADYTTRFFNLEVNGTELSHTFGQVKPAATGYYWEGPFEVTLNDGTNTIKVLDTSGWWANLNGILLTDNAELNPAEKTYAQIEAMSTKKTVVPAEPEVDEMEDVTISTDHPGGGVLLQSKQDGVITFTTDMTGHDYSSGNWFYWNFKVTSEIDRTVTFKTNARYLGDSGPVYSTDGENWDYLCEKNSSGTFTYDLKANEPVYFSCTLPYQYADMLEWLEELESKNSSRNGLVSVDYDFAQTGHETFTAAQITAGEANPHIGGDYYDIPMITLGSTSAPKYLYFSGRMHACETMGSYTLEGVVDYFAALSADDPFWDEYCIYVIPMIDVEGVENGDQGKSRNLTDLDASSAVDHDHNRDWTDGEEVFNYTKAAKAFVAERKTAGQQLELYIDFHCPYLNGYAGNYISYGLWNEEEVMLFSDILEEIVAADTRENKLTYDYDKGQNAWSQQASQEPAVSKTWFYNQGAVATFSFETLFTEKSPAYYAENVHQLGENIAKTTLQFLNEVHKSGENDITSFKIGETAGAIESGRTIGQVDMYYNDTSSVKEWSNLGTIDLEANVPVVLDFTAVGQSEGATGKFRLAATAVRLTDSEGNVTEIAAKDCFTANGNATQNNCRDDGLWMTQNYTSSGGTGDPTGCSVLITVEAPKTDTYTIEIYTWSNQDGGIYELTDSRNYITVALGEDADVTDVTPTVTVSDKATYAPTGAQNFAAGAVKYTVTAENGDTKDYFVTVTGGKAVEPAPETADKTALQSAVTAAGSYAESGYTADSWSIFSAALTAAQAVLDDQDAAQTEVDDALATLNTAVEALKCEAIFEAEDTYASNTGTWSEVTQYKGTGSTGHNKFSFAQATASSGQTVTFKLNVDKAGNYELYMTTKDNPDRAIFNVSVNGTLVGDPVDLYSSNSDGEFVEHKVGTAAFVAGENEVTLTLNGKNSGNTGKYYGGAFDYFRLVEVDEAATPVPEDVSFDLLALYQANAYTTTGVTPEEITDHNINKQRLKLTGNAANNEIAFDLGDVTAGTYEVILNSKYYKDYGTWSFKMAGNAIGGTIAFADAEKNGSYHDVSIGTIEHAGGKLDFTFVSVNGGTLVPVSVSLKVAQSGGAAADKTELQSAVTGAADYAEEDYTADSWSTFSAALTAAQSVLDDADASQSEINEALSALNSAIAGLQKAPTGDGTGTVLYENKFETLPEELQDVSGWQLVKLLDGTYALQGTSTANAGLLAQFTGVTLPEQYTVVVDMTMLENQGSSGYSAGVTFQHTSSSAFYHYRLDNGTSDTAQLYQWNGSASKKAQGSSLTLTDGEAYRLRITVDGATMTGYVDGNQVLTYSGAAAGGNVGLRVYSAAALFDNLVVYEGIVGPGVDESAPDMVIAGGEPVVWNNEDEGVYGENSGTWSDVTEAGQNGSAARSAEGGSATFSNYSPATGNFVVQWYVPVADGAETNITIQTLNGTWKYTVPAGIAAGWHTLGIVSGTENTAFTVNAESAGKIYADAVRLTPTTQAADEQYSPTGGGSTAIAVLVNQIGYDTGSSMRATVPNAVDGTKFQVVNAESGAVVYEGTVVSNIADFTAWSEAAGEYYITCAGAQSYNFSIGTNLIYRRSVENALKFMAETRSDTFCVGRAGIGWRDSHQFSFELNGLVLQYMANPSLYDNMDYEIYEVASCEYEELQVQDEPALIWLIQFAALRYYDLGANEGKNLHMLTKEQLAYYLYIYPEISEYVDEETYEKIRDYTISVWGNNSCNLEWYPVSGTNHDLYSVQTAFGGLKGSQPPGHSIVPNLLMYEVALRDGLGEDVAQKFFDAAYENCAYLISDDFDLNDPFYNKGQRMSEYITIPALAYFLEMYPGKAPSGLKAAIAEWAEVTIARSNNMWDIRMAVSMAAGDGKYYFHNPSLSGVALTQDYWTGAAYANADAQADYLSGGAPRNEPGNQAGLQAVTYAAARVLGSGETADRLQALGVAAIDDLFGRNPSGRAAFYHFTRDFVGGDLGWYKQYAGGNGVLEGHTAVIDANAPEACYPYNPDAYNTGYTEGWVSYNTAWNASLAYSAAEAVALEVQKPDGGAKVGSELTIILRAPVNMDSSAAETAEVVVTTHTGEQIKVALTETGNSSQYFSGTYTLPDVPYVTVSYGSGLFKNSSKVTVEDFVGTPVTSITLNEAEAELGMGETYQISAVVAPDNASDKSLSYVSSNTSVATVSVGGIVTAVGIGEATITVTSDFTPTVSAQCKVTVSAAAPKSLTLDAPETLNVFTETGKAAVTAIVYSDGSTVTENLPEVTYATSNKRVLAVAADGTLTPVAAGTATITATATVDGKEISGTAEITVTAEISYDLLALYKAGDYTADDGTTVTIAANTKDDLTGSYGLERVKLTGGAAGNEVSFLLDGLSAGEYQVTLYTKFYGGDWAYGIWSLMMDDQVLIENLDFDNEEKNGHYYNLDLGTVTLTDAAEHQFTFVSVDGGSVVPVSVTLTKCALPDVAKIGDVTYGTLSEAIADADDGAEIVLLADTDEASVVLLKGNTLDLNGHTLTADKYVAIYGDSKNDVYNHVVDSVGGGLLKVGKDRILIHKGNKHLPIWDDVNKGYTFANLNGFDKKTDESAENSVRYTFLPYLDASAYALITQGAEVSGVEMKVKATWNKAGDGMPGEVNFVYTDDLMQRFYAGYDPETGKYGNAFTLTLSGTDSVDNLAFEVIFVSETGVTLSCK